MTATAFRLELGRLLKAAAQLPQKPSPAKDALCEVMGLPKPRTPMQRAYEIADRSARRSAGLNPENQIEERHSHLVHADPGMTTPGI